MDRRKFLISGALLTSGLGSGVAFAEEQNVKKTIEERFKHFYFREDISKVVYFFDFTCPFSAMYHSPMLTWAKTAPKPIVTEFLPVINVFDGEAKLKRGVLSATGYYAAVATAKSTEQLEFFTKEVYDAYQTHGISLSSQNIWRLAVKSAGMNLDDFLANSKKIKPETLRYASSRLIKYQVSATPTVAVAGQSSFTPTDTGSDPDLFFNILNGLASQLILS